MNLPVKYRQSDRFQFRVWTGNLNQHIQEGGKMLYWYPVPEHLSHTEAYQHRPSLNNWLLGEDGIMQFTGVVDKNGTPVWEGDIVWYDDLEMRLSDAYCYAEVNWKNRGWHLDDTGFDLWINNSGTDEDLSKHIEVVGNIYETPHLLDSEHKWWRKKDVENS